jgi:hypothetical protein
VFCLTVAAGHGHARSKVSYGYYFLNWHAIQTDFEVAAWVFQIRD